MLLRRTNRLNYLPEIRYTQNTFLHSIYITLYYIVHNFDQPIHKSQNNIDIECTLQILKGTQNQVFKNYKLQYFTSHEDRLHSTTYHLLLLLHSL